MFICICPICCADLEEKDDKWYCSDCMVTFTDDEVSVRDADDDDDGMPSGCASCGGPYPYCKTSCKLFDN